MKIMRLVALVTIGVAATAANALVASARAEPIRIVAFGGSSTYGKGVDRQDTYPAQLERALRAKGHDVAVANAGVNGDTTRDALSRFDKAVPAGTKIVILEFGINDRFANVNPDTIRTNLDTLLTKLDARQIPTLLIGYTGSSGLETLAEKHNAKFMRFGFPGDNNDPKYRVSGDPQQLKTGIAHYNRLGYEMTVGKMTPLVEELIARVAH
jgi:acyl-CoA thioesterase I